MSAAPVYLLDSYALITAKNSYYAFDLCPGFWAGLLAQHGRGRVFSIDRVRGELMAGRKTDDLVQWTQSRVPDGFFREVDAGNVPAAYTDIMLWVQRHTRYLGQAKAKFATGADGWLVAYARVYGAVVVTLEQPAPEAKADIKLPDVCAQFDVQYTNTFAMLKELGVRFGLESTAP